MVRFFNAFDRLVSQLRTQSNSRRWSQRDPSSRRKSSRHQLRHTRQIPRHPLVTLCSTLLEVSIGILAAIACLVIIFYAADPQVLLFQSWLR